MLSEQMGDRMRPSDTRCFRPPTFGYGAQINYGACSKPLAKIGSVNVAPNAAKP